MHQTILALSTGVALLGVVSSPASAQIRTTQTRLLPGQSAVLSTEITSISTPFDSRRVNAALAREVAGDRELIGWSNCAAQLTTDGTVVYPDPGARRRLGSDVPCLYLVTGAPEDFQEYFVTQTRCNEGSSGAQACLDGYAVDTRVRNRVTTATQGSELVMNIERTVFFSILAAGELPTSDAGSRRTRTTQSNSPISVRMQRVASTQCELRFTVLTRRSSCQAFDEEGNALGEPVLTEGYVYVDYGPAGSASTAVTGATTCEQLGDFAEANAVSQNETAQSIMDYLNRDATVVGAAAGFLIGNRVAGSEGGKIGGMIGGAFGSVATGLNTNAMETVGPIRASVVGSFTEAACNATDLFDNPQTPPGEAPGGDAPIGAPGRGAAPGKGTDGQMCFVCTRVRTTTMTVYDRDGNVVEVQSETVCIEYGWVPC